MWCARLNHDIAEPRAMHMAELKWKRRKIFKNTKDFFEQKGVAIGRVRVRKYPQESNDWRFIALEPVSEIRNIHV
jgi:hypothetical protein